MATDLDTILSLVSSPLSYPLLLLAVCLPSVYLLKIYLDTPLNKIPGPWLSSLTNLWLVRKTHQRQRHLYDIELHRKYGPVVRVGPREVSLSSPAAVKAVYGNVKGKSLRKSAWYVLISPPHPEGFDLLSEPDVNKHRTQRRQISPVYTASSIADLEESLDSILVRNLASMRQRCGKSVDSDNWSHMFALDCLTASVFSKSTEQIIAGEDGGTIASIKKNWEYTHWATRFPLLHAINMWCSKNLGTDFWGRSAGKTPPIFEWAIEQLDVIMSATSGSVQKAPSNLATKLLSLHQINPLFTERHLTDMTLTHFGAGLETLGITLSAFLCNIIQRPHLQARIHEELDEALEEGRLVFSRPGVLEMGGMKKELKFLEACLRESMRLHPVIGVAFPRVVGPEGMLIDGVIIPSKTVVEVNPWVAGRSRELYGPDALEFRPERWLGMSREERIRIDTYNQTFGLGNHTCPGKHLAVAILHKVITLLFMNFSWEFKDPDAERHEECMFGVRWKDASIIWKERGVSDRTSAIAETR